MLSGAGHRFSVACQLGHYLRRRQETIVCATGQAQTVLPKLAGLTSADETALLTRVTDLRMALELVPGAKNHPRRGSA
jgi:hypothetical protein